MKKPAADDDRFLPLIPAGLGLVLLVMAASFGGVGRYQQLKSHAMLTWPSVEGTSTGCGVTSYRAKGETQDRHGVACGFKYEVEAKPFEFRQGRGGEDEAKAPMPYVAGQKVPIYFDPNDPADRELSRTRDQTELLFLGMGGVCGLMSLPFFYGAWRWSRRQRLASATR